MPVILKAAQAAAWDQRLLSGYTGIRSYDSGRAARKVLDIASIQFEDGSTYHQYQPLTKTGNSEIGSGFNDPLWLIACTTAYIKETGDWGILDERFLSTTLRVLSNHF